MSYEKWTLIKRTQMCIGVVQIMNMEKEQAKMANKKQINKTNQSK